MEFARQVQRQTTSPYPNNNPIATPIVLGTESTGPIGRREERHAQTDT
jgi:hypothetical protein